MASSILIRAFIWLAFSIFISSIPTNAGSATFPSEATQKLTHAETDAMRGVREGDRIYSGDVIYNTNELELYGFRRNLWPGGILVYDFSPEVSLDRQSKFLQACTAWTNSTPLSCKRRTSELSYILVKTHNGEACGKQANVSCSFIGMMRDKPQELYIYETHWSTQSVIQHEIGHAIGMVHEQSRPDRDGYVFVKYQNMIQGASLQFDIDKSVDLSGEYDLESIMHYSNCSFSRHQNCSLTTPDLQTLEPKACSLQKVGGTAITALDIDGVRRIYMPALHAVFDQRRDQSCGMHNLDVTQTRKMCKGSCQAASSVTYSKVEERSDSDCGSFFTPPDYRGICRSISKDYVRHWTDLDRNSCRYGTADVFEWWVECGCSLQTLPATCANYTSGINQHKLQGLLATGNEKERAVARYLQQVLRWKDMGAIEKGVADNFSKVVIRGVLATDFKDRIYDLLCTMRIIIEARRKSTPSYSINLALYQKLVLASNLTILN